VGTDDGVTPACNDRYRLPAFGAAFEDVNRQWGVSSAPLGNINDGLSMGINNPLALGNAPAACAGDAMFDFADTTPWSEPNTPWPAGSFIPCQLQVHSLSENLAFLQQATTVPLVTALVQPTTTIGPAGAITLTFPVSPYVQNMLLVLPPPICTNSAGGQGCDPAINPFYLEFDTVVGGDSLASAWVLATACDPVAGTCSVIVSGGVAFTDGDDGTPVVLPPNATGFGRLWTQDMANHWGSVSIISSRARSRAMPRWASIPSRPGAAQHARLAFS
jgi:hypothetical protein